MKLNEILTLVSKATTLLISSTNYCTYAVITRVTQKKEKET